MGCDFGYKDAYSWFSNTDILIRKVHEIVSIYEVSFN